MEETGIFEIREDCLLVHMPEEVDHHTTKSIGRLADHYLLITECSRSYLILRIRCSWIAPESGCYRAETPELPALAEGRS